MWDTNKCINYMERESQRKEERGVEEIFQKLTAEKFPNLLKNNLHNQDSPSTPGTIKTKRFTDISS